MKVTKLLDGTKINKKEFKTWMQALRSGEFNQTSGVLQYGDNFCCLGVACKVLVPENKKLFKEKGELSGLLPAHQTSSPLWLKSISEDFRDRQKKVYLALEEPNEQIGTSLWHISEKETLIRSSRAITWMNDSLGLSFDEIADVLELVYVHGMIETEEKV